MISCGYATVAVEPNVHGAKVKLACARHSRHTGEAEL